MQLVVVMVVMAIIFSVLLFFHHILQDHFTKINTNRINVTTIIMHMVDIVGSCTITTPLFKLRYRVVVAMHLKSSGTSQVLPSSYASYAWRKKIL